jgi:hypothetical protein
MRAFSGSVSTHEAIATHALMVHANTLATEHPSSGGAARSHSRASATCSPVCGGAPMDGNEAGEYDTSSG